MERSHFDQLFDDVSNWGRWGQQDERGTLNLLGPEQTSAAASLVSEGRTVSLAHELDTQAGPDNSKPSLHHMTRTGDAGASEPQFNMDFIATDFHGKSVTHLDALSHCMFDGRLYNAKDPSVVVSSAGAAFGSVLALAGGVAGRGVLLDVPRHRDEPWLEPGTAILSEELEAVAQAQGSPVGRGDIVFVRTGHRRRRNELGVWDPSDFSAGVHASVMGWLHERETAVLGADGDSDARPSPVEDIESPVHALALVAMGMPLVDNMNLEDLADTCTELGRWEFLCVIAPLRVPGGTGSPVNPVAIF